MDPKTLPTNEDQVISTIIYDDVEDLKEKDEEEEPRRHKSKGPKIRIRKRKAHQKTFSKAETLKKIFNECSMSLEQEDKPITWAQINKRKPALNKTTLLGSKPPRTAERTFRKRTQQHSESRKRRNPLEDDLSLLEEVKLKGGFLYTGQWKNRLMHGKGVLTYPDKSKYVGFFRKGKQNGYGEREWVDRKMYKGYWLQGRMQGKGQLFFPSGEVYIGDFKANLPNGRGIRKWPNGDLYEGTYRNGFQDGIGMFVSIEQGWKYEGEWSEGKIHGRGIC